MKKEELIKKCRYYKGEDKCPFSDSDIAWFWDMERVWVSHDGNFNGEEELYHNISGKKYSGIPFTLLMVMFTGWSKYTTDITACIDQFYKLIELYLDFVSEHYPKDKIPA